MTYCTVVTTNGVEEFDERPIKKFLSLLDEESQPAKECELLGQMSAVQLKHLASRLSVEVRRLNNLVERLYDEIHS